MEASSLGSKQMTGDGSWPVWKEVASRAYQLQEGPIQVSRAEGTKPRQASPNPRFPRLGRGDDG